MELNEHDIRTAFDTEGCLMCRRKGKSLNWGIDISNTDGGWIEALAKFLKARGYKVTTSIASPKGRLGKKPLYRLGVLRQSDVYRFLTDFPPLMIEKKAKAEAFFGYHQFGGHQKGPRSSRAVKEAYEIMRKQSKEMI